MYPEIRLKFITYFNSKKLCVKNTFYIKQNNEKKSTFMRLRFSEFVNIILITYVLYSFF